MRTQGNKSTAAVDDISGLGILSHILSPKGRNQLIGGGVIYRFFYSDYDGISDPATKARAARGSRLRAPERLGLLWALSTLGSTQLSGLLCLRSAQLYTRVTHMHNSTHTCTALHTLNTTQGCRVTGSTTHTAHTGRRRQRS